MASQTANPTTITSDGTGTAWNGPGAAATSNNVRAAIAMSQAAFEEVKLLIDSVISGDNKAAGNLTSTETYYPFGGSSDKWGTAPTVSQINSGNFGCVVRFNDTFGSLTQYLTAKFNFSIPSGATVNGFVVRVEAAVVSGKVSVLEVDHIEMTVHYTDAATGNPWHYYTQL